MLKPAQVLVTLVSLLLAFSGHYCSNAASPLQVGFYQGKCGANADVEEIVAGAVKAHFASDPTITAALLRLHFHDCFLNGCDASILLDGDDSEKTADTNIGLRGFDFIDAVKETLEATCPGVVSCADIIALATRDAVALAGGPMYKAETGRRDGNVSRAELVDENIPPPDISVAESIQLFQSKGVDHVDMTYLLGAHTVGVANCSFFQYRLYDFNGTGQPDPTMSPDLVTSLRSRCPKDATFENAANLDQNRTSIFTVDNSYYNQLKMHRGVLQIDQELTSHPNTTGIVDIAAESTTDFQNLFSSAMVNLGAVEVLTGSQGEIRTFCRAVNAKN
ncbi:OLC1v1004635C1 [Oldenlandia corymbosa var. corymbosa]|uniref:Peroxidase n=1 Tax=Oldenlandia corymbosa var. corymbosa TaxID=529605 RepID=A0AAV1DG85_OLDCO|nr:OLC1v1004635C1 [Oldenlandia corymbosa var. corymbosa]